MESFLEHLTLYDLLGYFVPGLFFWILCIAGIVYPMNPEDVKVYMEFESFLMLALVAMSYIMGLVLSEMSRIIVIPFIDWLLKKRKWIIDDGIIKSALNSSGLMKVTEEEEIGNKHIHVMHGVLQTDPKYKRIHNYLSAEGIYKNLIVALFLNMVIQAGILKTLPGHICWIGGGGVLLFLGTRLYRFRIKDREYTILWFVDKYTNIGHR